MSTTYTIDCNDADERKESTRKVVINNSVDSYVLATLPDGIVIKDTTDGTTAWKIIVSKTGTVSASQVTTV